MQNRGTIITGTNNVGFATVSPKACFFNDVASGIVSDATYAGFSIDQDSATVGCNAKTTNSPFATTDVSTKHLSRRLVACGLRVINVTPRLDRGGYVIGMNEPDHKSMDTFTTSEILSYGQNQVLPGDTKKWCHVEWRPADKSDFDFTSGTTATASVATAPSLSLLIVAPASKPQTYRYEFYAHFEYVGAIPDLRDSHVDPDGLAAVMQYMSRYSVSASDKQITRMFDAIKDLRHILDTVKTGVAAAAPLMTLL